MNTQTHIVYRNRLEHDFYEGGMLVPLVGALTVGCVIFMILAWLAGVLSRNMRGPSNVVIGFIAVIAFCCGIATFKWLLI